MSFATVVALFATVSAQIVDPVADFVNRDWEGSDFRPTEGGEVYCLEVDLDGDGDKDMFVSQDGLENGNSGRLWDVYENQGTSYTSAGGADFHPAAFYVGDFENYGWCFVYYLRGGGAEGILMVGRLKDGRFEEEKVRKIYPKDQDREFYEKLFWNSKMPEVETIPYETAMARKKKSDSEAQSTDNTGQTAPAPDAINQPESTEPSATPTPAAPAPPEIKKNIIQTAQKVESSNVSAPSALSRWLPRILILAALVLVACTLGVIVTKKKRKDASST